MKKNSLNDLKGLPDSWWEARKAALKEAEEMLKHPLSLEEKLLQVKRNSTKESSEEEFAKEIPMVIEHLKTIKTPLKFRDSANIYRWIYRKQITIDMLPSAVKDEFIKTRHFDILNKKKLL